MIHFYSQTCESAAETLLQAKVLVHLSSQAEKKKTVWNILFLKQIREAKRLTKTSKCQDLVCILPTHTSLSQNMSQGNV